MARVYLLSSAHAWLALVQHSSSACRWPSGRSSRPSVPAPRPCRCTSPSPTRGPARAEPGQGGLHRSSTTACRRRSRCSTTRVRPITVGGDARHERQHDDEPRPDEAAAEQFVIRLLPEDKAKVGAFNNKVEFADAGFTNDRDELIARDPASSISATRRACGTPSTMSLEQLQGVEGRRVVVVFTDGDDTGSRAPAWAR